MATLTAQRPAPAGPGRVRVPLAPSPYAADAALFLRAYQRLMDNAADFDRRGDRVHRDRSHGEARRFLTQYKEALIRPRSAPTPRDLPGLRVRARAITGQR